MTRVVPHPHVTNRVGVGGWSPPENPSPTRGCGGAARRQDYVNLDTVSSIFRLKSNNVIQITTHVYNVCLMYLLTRYTTNIHFWHTFGTRFFLENNATPPRTETPPARGWTLPLAHPIWISCRRTGGHLRVGGWADCPTLVITHANVD